MALVYFVDGANDPVPSGDAYAIRIDVEAIMSANASTCGWFLLTDDEKDNLIKTTTKKINWLFTKGNPVDDAQPLKFPLTDLVVDTEDQRAVRYYSIDEQKERLLRAVTNQIEADLQKGSISQASFSQGRESTVDRAFDLHAFTRAAISRFTE